MIQRGVISITERGDEHLCRNCVIFVKNFPIFFSSVRFIASSWSLMSEYVL